MIPPEVTDREKSYFPVPALKHLEGPYLELVKEALHAPVARERGIFQQEYVNRLLGELMTVSPGSGATSSGR